MRSKKDGNNKTNGQAAAAIVSQCWTAGLARVSRGRHVLVAAALLCLVAASAHAQPVIERITGVDVIASTIDQGVNAIAQGGWGQAWGPNIGFGNEPPTKVFVNGDETLTFAPSSGRIYFRVPPGTPLGNANITVEINGLTSAPFVFPISAYAPTGVWEGDSYDLDLNPIDEGNPAAPGQTLLGTGLTGLGADPNPEVTVTLGGLPVQVVSLEAGFIVVNGEQVQELELPGVYTLRAIVPDGIAPGWQGGAVTVGGVTWNSPNDTGWQVFIGGDGGGGGEGTPAISEGGIILATGLPLVQTAAALSIISIYGQNFATDTILGLSPEDLDENGNLPTKLGGACVEIGGERSPFFAITPTQANVQVPRTPTLGPVDVVMIRDCDTPEEIRSEVAMVTIEEATPAFFLYPPYAENALIAARHNSDFAAVAPEGTFNDPAPSRPAKPGDVLVLYGTGWGPTTAEIQAGELATGLPELLPEGNPSATFGGAVMDPADVFYVLLSPGYAGLYQLAIRVPQGAQPGDNQVVFTAYGKSTPVGPVIPVIAP